MKLPLLLPTLPVPVEVDYPVIEPVREDMHRPFWSVMIPTYNRADYLERTLKSVLANDPGPDEMQIEVIDNCSMVDTEAVVKKVGGKRISFYRQPQTVHPTQQGTTCIERACGRWVHIMHDDDLLMPGFYTAYKKFIKDHPKIGMVSCRAISINENDEWQDIINTTLEQKSSGVVQDAIRQLSIGCFVVAPTAVVARDVYEKIGGLNSNLIYTSDWELWIRIAEVAPIGYIHHPYFLYRLNHEGSETRRLVESRERKAEVLAAIECGVHRLPVELQKQTLITAYKQASESTNYYRRDLHARQKHVIALHYAFEGFRLYPTVRTFLVMLKSAAKAGKHKIKFRHEGS